MLLWNLKKVDPLSPLSFFHCFSEITLDINLKRFLFNQKSNFIFQRELTSHISSQCTRCIWHLIADNLLFFFLHHVITTNLALVCERWGGCWTNQRPVSRSSDHSRPMRGQCPGQVTTLDQSEVSMRRILDCTSTVISRYVGKLRSKKGFTQFKAANERFSFKVKNLFQG